MVGGVLDTPGTAKAGVGMQLVKSRVLCEFTPAILTVAVGWRKLKFTSWGYRGLSITPDAHTILCS